MHGGMIDRYVPDRDRDHHRRSDTRRSSSTLSSIPIRSAALSSIQNDNRRPPSGVPTGLDPSLPKNFPKPLTCHFWHQNGRCSKRDIDCAYAHYDTGYISGAPVTPLGASEAVAGKNVDRYVKTSDSQLLADIQKREESVPRREAELQERQCALRRREEEVEDWHSTVSRREIEVEEKERIVNRMGASLARKKKELKILEKRIARREEALREKGI